MIGQSDIYIDAAPGNIYHINAGAFCRRYFHVGALDAISFYAGLSAGVSYIDEVAGKYRYGYAGELTEVIFENPGDVSLFMAFEPGVKVKLFRNFHLFLGPTLSTQTMGMHVGIGF